MKSIRIATHSLVLVVADLAGIGAGATLAFRILGVPNQVWLQLPIAVLLSVGCFCAWILAMGMFGWRGLEPAGSGEMAACVAASLLWAPLVFVPFHYFTQGYLTSMGNLIALASYQIPVNSVCAFFALLVRNWKLGKSNRQS